MLKLAILSVIIWYMLVAVISYLTYKQDTMEYVTSNLEINAFTIVINILFCINAITSYPIQILCCFMIIEKYQFFNQPQDSKCIKNIKIYLERVVIVVLISLITSVIPNLIDFLNIFGTLGVANLGFILPPLIYISFVGAKKMNLWILMFNIFLTLFGVVGGAFSIYQAIKNMIENY